MIANFFVKIFPYIFILSFIYFEFSPVYFYDNELIKPFLSFLVVYSWICHDVNRFRPLWLLIFGLFYDFLKDGIVGITPLFFIILSHMQQKKSETLISFDFKETWIKFIIFLILYFIIIYLCNYFFENSNYNFKKNIFSLILTILLFPIFFSLIEKLTIRFGRYDN
tara:strand:+ start:227 stop:724 length:498 start_codon:yes stop_codon:yes gene_type:complete